MSADKRRDSTAQLIAEAQALRGDTASNARPPATRKLVRQSEQLIGKAPQSSKAPWLVLGLVLLVAIAVVALVMGRS